MSGGFDAIADIGLGDVLSSAADLGSVVTDLGTEFASSFDITSFEVPSFDVSSLGGFDVAGSFAGDASWFDTFNSGAILDKIPSVSDFNLSSISDSLPSLSSIKDVASTVQGDLVKFASDAQSAFAAYQKVAPLVNLASSALGIQNPINAVIAPLSQAVGIAGTAAGVAGSVATGSTGSVLTNPTVVSTGLSLAGGAASPLAQTIGTGVSLYNTANAIGSTITSVSQPGVVVASNGIVGGTFRELTNAELAQVTKNVNPLFINSLVDPSTAQPLNYNTAVASKDSLDPLIKSYASAIAEAEQNIQSNNSNILAIETELRDENLPDDRRQLLEEYLQANYENNAIQQNTIDANTTNLNAATGILAADQAVITNTNNNATRTPAPVVDSSIPILVNQTTSGVSLGAINTSPVAVGTNAAGITIPTSLTDLALATDPGSLPGTNARNLVQEARYQKALKEGRQTQAQSFDWRVKLQLAPNSTYLYNDTTNGPGLMAPLRGTDGVIFPYTPAIDTAYKANYDSYDLTHSNYRGYFYKNSYVDVINIRAQFTAQDTTEANYLLAVIHFFRSATKMFYGKDPQRGAPPPLVYLSGYGDFQFNNHPCVISQFNYQLPPDVDYIRAQSALSVNTNMLGNRIRNPISNNPLSYIANRLLNSNLLPGALDFRPTMGNLPVTDPTYVPTKMEISVSLLPIQSRAQVSNNFSVKEFSNGNLLKGGYW